MGTYIRTQTGENPPHQTHVGGISILLIIEEFSSSSRNVVQVMALNMYTWLLGHVEFEKQAKSCRELSVSYHAGLSGSVLDSHQRSPYGLLPVLLALHPQHTSSSTRGWTRLKLHNLCFIFSIRSCRPRPS